jgi:hypothetical protein
MVSSTHRIVRAVAAHACTGNRRLPSAKLVNKQNLTDTRGIDSRMCRTPMASRCRRSPATSSRSDTYV